MALIARYAFIALLLLPYQWEAMAENCSQTRCLLSPVGEDQVASEFRLQSSEKGVRLVYISLVIGNASYDPLELPDVFLPHRWIWANTIHEPMLSLHEDYDILSAGLLNYQVRSIEVKLKDHPSGCLAKLNSTCQNLAVGRMLLENVTSSSSGDILHKKTPVVCVAVIKRTCGCVRYNCCGMHKEARTGSATIRCDQRIDDWNGMEKVACITVVLLSFLLALFAPALPLAIPKYVFSLEDEVEKENRQVELTNMKTTAYERIAIPVTVGDQNKRRETGADQSKTEDVALHVVTSTDTSTTSTATANNNNKIQEETGQNTSNCVANGRDQDEENEFIPVDDSSPMSVSTLLRESVQKFPDIQFSFNIKLAVMCFCVYPCVLSVQPGLYYMLKKTSMDEIRKKRVLVESVFGGGVVFVNVTVISDELALLVETILMIITIFILVLFLKPHDFSRGEKEFCGICHVISKSNNSFNFSLASRGTLGDDIHRHLKILHHCVWGSTVAYGNIVVSIYYSLLCLLRGCVPEKMRKESRGNHIFCVFFHLICLIFALLLTIVGGVFCLLILILFLINSLVVFSPVLAVSTFSMVKIFNCFGIQGKRFSLVWIFVVCFFIIYVKASLLLFFNCCLFIITFAIYIIIGLALNVSIVTPFLAFVLVLTTNVYLCYAKMQSKYKEVKKMISERLQELHMNSNVPKDTIRAEIYWFVCDKVLPIKSEMCRMLRNMVLVIAFLFLALFSIVFFGNENDISTLTTTISVFFTGSIPALFLKVLTTNRNVIGWPKIKMEREIEKAVREYRGSRIGESVEQQILETLV